MSRLRIDQVGAAFSVAPGEPIELRFQWVNTSVESVGYIKCGVDVKEEHLAERSEN
jgi:hypothetical protein